MQDRYLSLFFTSGQSRIDVPKLGILMENHQNSFLFFSLRMRLFFVLVPVMPPLNITATNTSSTTILLTWNPIPLNYSNGPILEYRITFTEVQKSVHKENRYLWQRIVDGNKLSAFVTGLKKYTRYCFRMSGINRRGVGLDSMPITATTDEDGMCIECSCIPTFNVFFRLIFIYQKPYERMRNKDDLAGGRFRLRTYGGRNVRLFEMLSPVVHTNNYFLSMTCACLTYQ